MSGAGFGSHHAGLGTFGGVSPADANARSDARRRRRAYLGVGTSFGLLAAICLLAAVLAWRNAGAAQILRTSWRTEQAATAVLTALLNAETGQRGFLLTHDGAYLKSYEDGIAAYPVALDRLSERVAEQPERTALVADLARLGDAKVAELDRTLRLAETGHATEALAIVSAGTGERLMDAARDIVQRLSDDVQDRIHQASILRERLSVLLLLAIVAAGACIAIVASVVIKDTRRHLRLLEDREARLREQAWTLERRVSERTSAVNEANQRLRAALLAADVTVATQDRDLVFTWISSGALGHSAEDIVGRSETDVTPPPWHEPIVALKRAVIETGQAARSEVRVVHEGVEKWWDLSVQPLADSNGATSGVIAGAVEITRYKEQQARIRLLMHELKHRSKNLLAVIHAVMRQTAANSESLADFDARFSARLQALAGAQDLLVQQDWQGASLRELVRSQLGHYTEAASPQIEMSGPLLHLPPDAAQHVGMALHELATNAAKYGALSVPEGRVRIGWEIGCEPGGRAMCRLSWQETEGPPVEPPSRRGFGRVVIERLVARSVGGSVTIDYPPEGVRWELSFPLQEPAR